MREYLHDMLLRIERIEEVVTAGKQTFEQSFMHQDTVIRNYEVIGEIAKRLPEDLLQSQPRVTWGQIKGFRDFLVHNYDKIDLEVVWSATNQLPALKSAVLAMLESFPDDDTGRDQ